MYQRLLLIFMDSLPFVNRKRAEFPALKQTSMMMDSGDCLSKSPDAIHANLAKTTHVHVTYPVFDLGVRPWYGPYYLQTHEFGSFLCLASLVILNFAQLQRDRAVIYSHEFIIYRHSYIMIFTSCWQVQGCSANKTTRF